MAAIAMAPATIRTGKPKPAKGPAALTAELTTRTGHSRTGLEVRVETLSLFMP